MARADRETWAKRVERWRESGLSAAEFAAEIGVTPKSLSWWKWQLGKTSAAPATKHRRKTTKVAVSPLTFVEMTAPVRSEPIEIVFPSGVRVRVPVSSDAAALTRVIQALTGHKIQIEPARAEVVRRIFAMYLRGMSYSAIAYKLNAENVEPARRGRYRRKGWVASSIRSILHNAAYVGEFTFRKRDWRRLPGTNIRRPRERAASDVLTQHRPDLAIIDRAKWEATQERLREVRATYVKTDGPRRGRSGKQNNYPLSGLLVCGECGAPMTIHRGTSAAYYRCSDNKKRGTCPNRLAQREDVARDRLLSNIERRFRSREALAYLTQAIARELGNASRSASAELSERRSRLARSEERIKALIALQLDGDRSEYLAQTRKDLEAQARADLQAIEELTATMAEPVDLPTPEVVMRQAGALRELVEADPLGAREALRSLFEDGTLALHPEQGRALVA